MSRFEAVGWMVACIAFTLGGLVAAVCDQFERSMLYIIASTLCRIACLLIEIKERGKPDGH